MGVTDSGKHMDKETLQRYSKQLRLSQTDAERKLWRALRNKQVAGFKFRRQQQIGTYIVDFVCLENRLIIELDGGQHMLHEHYDTARTAWLNKEGFRVLRFWNNQMLQETDAVLQVILCALTDHPHPTLPPQGGGL